jgi:hypothetical protein
MSFAWQTVEQAAVTLGISTRTIARRIAKGELDSRLSSGRREVYIPVPQGQQSHQAATKPQYASDTIEADFTESDVQPEPSYEQTVRHTVSAASTHSGDVETSTALILAEDRARRAEMAITVIQQSTAIVRDEVQRARAGARWAWAVVAAMAACMMVAIGWTSGNLTRAQQQADAQREKALLATTEKQEQSQKFSDERQKLLSDLSNAQQAAAKAHGELQEVRSEEQNAQAQLAAVRQRPDKSHASLTQRLANAVFGRDGE